jgi:hypothetical protein
MKKTFNVGIQKKENGFFTGYKIINTNIFNEIV